VGVLIGDSLVYWFGHHYGRKLLKRWPFRMFIDEEKIETIKVKLHDHGDKVLFGARFMPGLRSTVFFASGLLHFPYRKMIVYDGLAALISVPTIVYSVFYFGDFLEYVIRFIKRVEGGIAGVILLIVLALFTRYYLKRHKKVHVE
jgi:membrane protein DedA with SNARE-associated domain